MGRRWTAKLVVLASWGALLSICAGYGVFRLANNLGIGDEWSGLLGSLAFTSNILMIDHWISE